MKLVAGYRTCPALRYSETVDDATHPSGQQVPVLRLQAARLWKLWVTWVQCNVSALLQPFDGGLPEGVAELRPEETQMTDGAAGLFR